MAATPEATQRFANRFSATTAEGHFRLHQGLMMSSIGAGTYLGDANRETDERYRAAIARAVESGVNVIDTAINYRFQRSERAIGLAIRDLESTGRARRDELVIATKAGFLAFDGSYPADPREYFLKTFVNSGIIGPRDLVGGSHCMSPRYLQHQIDQSLRNLSLHAIDIFYLHNPETQLSEIDHDEFYKRLRVAFGFLEGAVRDGKIRMYGTATWNGYRVEPDAREFVSIAEVVRCAHEVAGAGHHFRAVQLPYNLAMLEAYANSNQTVGQRVVSMLQACSELSLTVMASASIFQSRLTRNLPPGLDSQLPGLKTDTQRAIQFVRSTPGIATALIGMSQLQHVDENLETATVAPAPESIRGMFDVS